MVQGSRGLQVTRDNLAGRKDTKTVVKVNRSDVELVEGPTKVKIQNIGNAFVLGHSVNGVLGVANGINGSQITLGTAGYGALTTDRVINYNDVFVEYLRNDEYEDTTNTTATTDYTNHEITFNEGEVYQTGIIYTEGTAKTIIDATISQLPNTSFQTGVSTFTPTAHYLFNNDATDEVGNYDGTFAPGTYATGKLNQAISTDGVDDVFQVNGIISGLSGDFAVAFWFKTAATELYARLFEFGSGNDDRALISLDGSTGNKLSGLVEMGSGSSASDGTTIVTDDVWHHVVFNYYDSTSTWEVFLDNSSEITGASGAGSIENITTNQLTIGGGDTAFLQGYFDDFRVYDHTLDAAQRLAIINSSNGTEETTLSKPSATFSHYLSANNGANWETALPGTALLFTNTGTALKYKALANDGTAKISIEDDDGFSSPIKISYTTRS